MGAQPIYTMVASGATLSAPVSVKGCKGLGLWCPTVASGAALTVRAAADPAEVSSANFFPVELTPPNSGAMKFVQTAGQKYFPLGQIGEALAAVQFQFDVAMTTPTTLALVTKF